MKNISAILIVMLLYCHCSPEKNDNPAKDIADAHGVDQFDAVKKIEFTFNVQRDTNKPSRRQWIWDRQANEITFITDTSQTSFTRYDTSTAELKKLNARFTNDEYWLLFPFHLAWDQVAALTDEGMVSAPISGKPMRKINIQYNDSAGFTPGDRYTVYADNTDIVREWEFYGQHATEPGLVTTWENYRDYNGMQLATEHKSKDGKFRLWFTGVKVQ